MASSEKSRQTTEIWLAYVKTLDHVPTDDELYDWCVDHKIEYDYWAQTSVYKGIKTRLAELAGVEIRRERRKQEPGRRDKLLKKYGLKPKGAAKMLDYKIKRLLLNPHRINYFYELDTLLEFWDVNDKFDQNEDLYTAFKSLKSVDGKYDKLSEADKMVVLEMILNSNVYKEWVKDYNAQEFYRNLPWHKKLAFHTWNVYLSIIKYPQVYLNLVNVRIKTYLDYQASFKAFVENVKEGFKTHNLRLNDLTDRIYKLENKRRKKKDKKVKKHA